jgi:hypothetical protein
MEIPIIFDLLIVYAPGHRGDLRLPSPGDTAYRGVYPDRRAVRAPGPGVHQGGARSGDPGGNRRHSAAIHHRHRVFLRQPAAIAPLRLDQRPSSGRGHRPAFLSPGLAHRPRHRRVRVRRLPDFSEQVGEFSFVLSKTGVAHGLLSGQNYQMFLDVSVLTMAVTPFVIAIAPRLADAAMRLPLPPGLKAGSFLPVAPATEQWCRHCS